MFDFIPALKVAVPGFSRRNARREFHRTPKYGSEVIAVDIRGLRGGRTRDPVTGQ